MNSDTSTTEQLQTLELMVADYLLSCRARGLAHSTTEGIYARNLRKVFLPWCSSMGIHSIDDLDQRILDRFTAELLSPERGLARGSARVYVRTVSQFLRWAQERTGMPKVGPRLPAIPRTVVTTLSQREIRRLEDASYSERDRLILRILAETGLRVGELCALTTDDVERVDDRTFLRVRGKGNHRRVVPVTPEIARRLPSAARYRQGSRPLFTARLQYPGGEYGALTPAGVRQMVRRLARRAGITRRVHPHLFRHTFATEALRCGMDSVQLATLLGHSGVAMIEKVYAHLTADDAYDAIIAMQTASRNRERLSTAKTTVRSRRHQIGGPPRRKERHIRHAC